MVTVVRLHAITLNEPQRHRRHAAKRHPHPATREKASARLILQPQAGEIVGREVHGVAHLQPLGLNGGKHGIGPTKLAATLVFHRGGLQHNLIAKTARNRLVGPVSARRGHHRQQDSEEYRMPKNVFHCSKSYFNAKLSICVLFWFKRLIFSSQTTEDVRNITYICNINLIKDR